MRRPPIRSALSLVLVAVLAVGCGSGDPVAKTPVADAQRTTAPPTRQVVVVIDGKKRTVTTTGRTVAQVLAGARIGLGPYDLVKPERGKPAGDKIKVRRLLSKPVTKKVKIKRDTVEKKDKDLAPFSRKVVRKGRDGLKIVTTAFVRRKGKKVKRVIDKEVKRKPVDRIVKVGPSGSAGGDVAGLNWAGLAECESGGNPKAVNPAGYYGLYQFSLTTWRSVGGSGLPSEASSREQTYRAQLLYKKVGGRWQGQWPHCGKYLF